MNHIPELLYGYRNKICSEYLCLFISQVIAYALDPFKKKFSLILDSIPLFFASVTCVDIPFAGKTEQKLWPDKNGSLLSRANRPHCV